MGFKKETWCGSTTAPLPSRTPARQEEMKRYETGYYDDKPGRWEESAKTRPDVAASHLKPPSVLFPSELSFDDGEHRVELLHLGIAHTHGDAVAWLPKERILFTATPASTGLTTTSETAMWRNGSALWTLPRDWARKSSAPVTARAVS